MESGCFFLFFLFSGFIFSSVTEHSPLCFHPAFAAWRLGRRGLFSATLQPAWHQSSLAHDRCRPRQSPGCDWLSSENNQKRGVKKAANNTFSTAHCQLNIILLRARVCTWWCHNTDSSEYKQHRPQRTVQYFKVAISLQPHKQKPNAEATTRLHNTLTTRKTSRQGLRRLHFTSASFQEMQTNTYWLVESSYATGLFRWSHRRSRFLLENKSMSKTNTHHCVWLLGSSLNAHKIMKRQKTKKKKNTTGDLVFALFRWEI